MRTVLLTFILALFATAVHAGDNWPEFRGPHGDGQAGQRGVPLEWSETSNVKWKTPIHGKGWSSPVVWDNQIWMTTATEDGKEMFAVCVDAATGKIVYDLKVLSPENPQYCIPFNSYASPTPAIEAGRVYLHFGAHGTLCLDTDTGKTLWSRLDFECYHHRCPASSPILFGDLVILTFDGFDVQYLVALNKQTGQTVWKKDRNIDYGTDDGDPKKAYATPTIIDVAGRSVMVSPSSGATIAYDPATGEELWRIRSGGMNAAARPVFGNGLVYATTANGGFQLFAMRPDGHGDVTGTHVAWKYNKSVPTRPSPLLVDDLLFMVSDKGIVSGVDTKSAQQVWQQRLKGDFSASPLGADDRIYFFAEDGTTYVVAPSRDYKLLATNKLDDGFMASPAVTGKALILRTKTSLYRIEQ